MALLKNAIVVLLFLSTLLAAEFASAQDRGQNRSGERIRILEDRVNQLQDVLSTLHQRVAHLENNRRPHPLPPPGVQEVICMLKDTGFNRVFIGKGRMRLEAEEAVRQTCGSGTHPNYCQDSIKCSDPRNDPPINGAICVLTDTGFSRLFKGESKTLIEAEFNARKACGDGTHPNYCVGSVRCDTY